MIENEQNPRRKVVLAGLERTDVDFAYQMEELANLADANNMEIVGTMTQKMERPHGGTYFGKGKVEELGELVKAVDAEMVVTNDELSPSQIRNLEAGTGVTMMDRTALILDIFATRAKTKVAKLQVAIAQLQYQLPRLRTSMNVRMDQQTGGGGGSFTSRGAGETKLELNRRHIEHKISELRKELANIEADDQTRRVRREKEDIKTVALVGYTNAGKSTIMNGLVKRFGENQEKTVFQADMLFATLETAVRKINLPDKQTFLLSDTVGFVSKLPHGLVAAFKATLAEAAQADLLIQVVDYSDPDYKAMMETTTKTLKEIGVRDVPMVIAFNKADRIEDQSFPVQDNDEIIMSAKSDDSLDKLIEMVRTEIFADHLQKELMIPFADGQVVAALNDDATVHETEYTEEGTRLVVTLTPTQVARYADYIID